MEKGRGEIPYKTASVYVISPLGFLPIVYREDGLEGPGSFAIVLSRLRHVLRRECHGLGASRTNSVTFDSLGASCHRGCTSS